MKRKKAVKKEWWELLERCKTPGACRKLAEKLTSLLAIQACLKKADELEYKNTVDEINARDAIHEDRVYRRDSE